MEKVVILYDIFRSNIIWKCPDITKKSKPLECHRESNGPIQAIVAPQRRKTHVIKERKEELMQNHSKHNHEVAQEETHARMKIPSPKTKQKSRSTQVSLGSSRPIKTDAETQSEINNSILQENDDGKSDDLPSKQRTLTTMTPSCQSREAAKEDVPEKTEDSLNTNITAFVSTR